MSVSELIGELERLRDEYGDVETNVSEVTPERDECCGEFKGSIFVRTS